MGLVIKYIEVSAHLFLWTFGGIIYMSFMKDPPHWSHMNKEENGENWMEGSLKDPSLRGSLEAGLL